MNKIRTILFSAVFLSFTLGLTSCGGGTVADAESTVTPPANTYTVRVSWTANKEKSVNQTGGGYKVYYSATSGFNIGSANVITVPYVSGSTSPTSTTVTLAAGTYFFKIAAYSAFIPPGGSSGATSAASNQFSITVP